MVGFFIEKKQVQSAHFQTGNMHYMTFHLSDDTNQDSVVTFHLIEDIIEKFPEVIDKEVLVIRNDNHTHTQLPRPV